MQVLVLCRCVWNCSFCCADKPIFCVCIAGMIGMFGWLLWCAAHRKNRYVWRCAMTVVGIHLSVLLELLDFPPLFWTLDAHALWHACTAPLNLLWWKWVLEKSLCVLSCLHGIVYSWNPHNRQPGPTNNPCLLQTIKTVLSQSWIFLSMLCDTWSGDQPVMWPAFAQSQSWWHKWVFTVCVVISCSNYT